MEKVVLDYLSSNSLFHFTLEKNLSKIEEEGLLPVIGENANGIEKTPKIFFSKGEIGILKITEVWLRWLMNKIYGINNKLGIYNELTEEEKEKRLIAWTKEFISKEFLNDEEKKEVLFAYFYKYIKKRIYLQLDIRDGVEYDSKDIDENKIKLQGNRNIDYLYAKTIYGEFSNIDIPIMDEWNMHTKSNVGVSKSKIKQVITKEGRTDMFTILIQIYDKYKDIPHHRCLLDDFIEYAKKKEMINEEGNKNDQINHSRYYQGKILKRSHR